MLEVTWQLVYFVTEFCYFCVSMHLALIMEMCAVCMRFLLDFCNLAVIIVHLILCLKFVVFKIVILWNFRNA